MSGKVRQDLRLSQSTYMLNRDFKAERPEQKWVTDIWYIKTIQGTLYFSVIRDLFDSSIVTCKTGTEQNWHHMKCDVSMFLEFNI